MSDIASCDALVARVLKEHGGCDYLINNAGRSIRRGVHQLVRPLPRFRADDAAQLFRRAAPDHGLPAEDDREEARPHHQHLVDRRPVERAAVLGVRRVEVRARLVSACAASEFLDKGINFTTINMPLVRTPMIAPTKMYENVPTLSPEQAADLVVEAIVYKPVRIATRLGIFGAVATRSRRSSRRSLLNTAFNMFPDSSAAAGKKEGERAALSPEQMAFRAADAGNSLVAAFAPCATAPSGGR